MPKEAKSKSTVRKYRKAWESEPEFAGWLTCFAGDATQAFCRVCKCSLKAHKRDLQKHGESKKHVEALNHLNQAMNHPKITHFGKKTISEKKKIVELKIAAFISEHCALNAVDHLGGLINQLDDTSEGLKELKLHRTKCTALIKNVLSPCLLEDLITDVGESFYSMVIDESTAVDTKKLLCIMMRFFSKTQRKIVTTFYRLIEIEAGDATTMSTVFKAQLEKDGVKLEKLIGIGVDGANVMTGVHHSFSSILKQSVKELVVVKCVCHSLHLAAEHACKTLPRYLDFIVKECHKWFSCSTKRQIHFSQLYETLADKRPLKIDKLSGTRWLARCEAIIKILDQWDALKLLFGIVRDTERCYTADQLHSMLSSNTNKLYLIFLSYILKSLTDVNKIFQSDNVDPLELLQDLDSLLYSYLRLLVTPARLERVSKKDLPNFKFRDYVIAPDSINFGYSFLEFSTAVNPVDLRLVKERCRDFLINLCEQLQCRIPGNIAILERMSFLSPQSATSQVKPDITDLVMMFKNVCGSIDSTVDEWNMLHMTQWSQLTTSEQFWIEVHSDVNAAGHQRFGHISKFALTMLCLPFSNAAVERAFSIVNIIKDKLRNRMAVITADSIMRVRYSLKTGGCIQFEPTPNMLRKFNSEDMYRVENLDGDANAEILQAFVDV